MDEKYSVSKIDSANLDKWDNFVKTSPQGTLFHTTVWACIIKEVFNRDFTVIVLEIKKQIVAGILFWPKKAFSFTAITQIPITPYQGILFRKSNTDKPSTITAEHHKYSKKIIDFLKDEYHIIDIPLSPGVTDNRPFEWSGFATQTAFTYSFRINEPKELYKQFSQDLRRKIKKATNQNISYRSFVEGEPLTQYIFDSYSAHNTLPTLSKAKIQHLIKACINNNIGHIYYQYLDDKPVAGIFLLSDDNTVYAVYSGISKESRTVTNTEIMHVYILSLPENIGKQFDFLGANTKEIEQFKRAFGGELVPYFKVHYSKSMLTRFIFSMRKTYQQKKRNLNLK